MKSESVWGDFTAAARIKGERAETRWQRELWARLPVPTELICSCTEPLAQFSRNRSPVHSPATQNTLTRSQQVGVSSAQPAIWGNLLRTFRFLLVYQLDTNCPTQIKRSVMFSLHFSLCSRLPATGGDDRNLAPTGVRMSSAPFLFRCSSRGDAAQSLGRRRRSLIPRRDQTEQRPIQGLRSCWRVNKSGRLVVCGRTKHCWPPRATVSWSPALPGFSRFCPCQPEFMGRLFSLQLRAGPRV